MYRILITNRKINGFFSSLKELCPLPNPKYNLLVYIPRVVTNPVPPRPSSLCSLSSCLTSTSSLGSARTRPSSTRTRRSWSRSTRSTGTVHVYLVDAPCINLCTLYFCLSKNVCFLKGILSENCSLISNQMFQKTVFLPYDISARFLIYM